MIFLFLFFLVFGIYLLIFGLKLLFKNGFVENLQKGIWKSDTKGFTDGGDYNYNKYWRGVENVLLGSVAIIISGLGILKYFELL
jgi:hypothetical protein